MKIFITGGHFTPALTVIETIEEKYPEMEIFYIGRRHSLEGDTSLSVEYQEIARRKIKFLEFHGGRMQRRWTDKTLKAILRIPWGFLQTFWWITRYQPKVILSFGGYVALPTVFSAWLWRKKIITHEQTVVSGLANRLIALMADKICLTWPESITDFSPKKTVVTGNPIRREIIECRTKNKTNNKPTIYITGGNQGSHKINIAVEGCLEELLKKYQIYHQCGGAEEFKDYERLETKQNQDYTVAKYFSIEEVVKILLESDMAIGRSGANTVYELMFLGKPAIFIPISWVEKNEQYLNAKRMAELGGAVVLEEKDLNPENLFLAIENAFSCLNNLRIGAKKCQSLIKTDAAEKIAEMIL